MAAEVDRHRATVRIVSCCAVKGIKILRLIAGHRHGVQRSEACFAAARGTLYTALLLLALVNGLAILVIRLSTRGRPPTAAAKAA